MYYEEAKNSEIGICPFCKSNNINYYEFEHIDDGGFYWANCDDCEKEFQEHYTFTFVGNFMKGE